jgi:transcriptional regulator with XRE-family HTH domain
MTIEQFIKEWLSDELHGRRDLQLLADRAGVSRALLHRILAGERRVTPETAVKLAPVLGRSKLELLAVIGFISPAEIQQFAGGQSTDPDLAAIVQAIRDHPEKARAVAPLLKTILEESNHSPGDIQDLLEALLALPENRRQGLLMALGK